MKLYLFCLVIVLISVSCKDEYKKNRYRISSMDVRVIEFISYDTSGCLNIDTILSNSNNRKIGIAIKINREYYADKKVKRKSFDNTLMGLDGSELKLTEIKVLLNNIVMNDTVNITNYLFGDESLLYLSQKSIKKQNGYSITNKGCLSTEYFSNLASFIEEYNTNSTEKILGERLVNEIIFCINEEKLPNVKNFHGNNIKAVITYKQSGESSIE